MKTIEIYEKTETSVLQALLKEYEEHSERNEILIDLAKENDNGDLQEISEKLQPINNDYAIDISLMRMELNRRLWNEK